MKHKGVINREPHLKDIIDLQVLQRIQDTFSQAMGLAAMVVSKSGQPVTRASNFQPMCNLIRSTEKGRARCHECDAAGGFEALKSGKPHSYICTNGLVDVAAPIVIDGEYFGGIYCGQILAAESREESLETIIQRNEYLGVPRSELLKIAQAIPVLPRARIDAAAEMLQLTANYIVELGLANLTKSQLLRETEEKASLQAALQDAQLRALQSQVNPHFLFNSLALLGYLAVEENAPRTQEMAYCLSDLLRYSLRNMAKTVSLQQELDIVKHYLAIQELRLEERLKIQIDINPALYQVKIPCMILQPLVENAIVHGVEPVAKTVTIQVRAYPWLQGMMLEVYDNGAGIDPIIAEAVNARTFTYRQNEGASIGLQNVIRRLDGIYGTEFDVRVEGGPNQGTRIMLFIPCNKPTCI
ncbi:MAG: PocR ligand-binding domain-containing protein [Anaerolineae bacterium]|nr:PocR ligand-binding domain-containing protein [Anaerolineae bacterium]MCB9107330.1 PocR ligand-binding domain-containing protein [Anaerolineales bacterium]